jgi:hypothetical protein
MLEIERGITRSYCVLNWFWKRLWTCRNTHYVMNEWINEWMQRNKNMYTVSGGTWSGVVVSALRYYSDGPGIDSRWYHWIFSFRPYHGPGVDSAPSENFLGVKAAGAWGWQPHHFHVPNVMEIWEPKPPRTLWAIPGLFTFTFIPYWESPSGQCQIRCNWWD